MTAVIIRNRIRCAHCGAEVESACVHDFQRHACAALIAARGADGLIAADGGLEYLRRFGHPADWIEASICDPPIDAVEEDRVRQQRIRAIDLETAERRRLEALQAPDAHERLARAFDAKGVAVKPPRAH
jgi:hypothetical protein